MGLNLHCHCDLDQEFWLVWMCKRLQDGRICPRLVCWCAHGFIYIVGINVITFSSDFLSWKHKKVDNYYKSYRLTGAGAVPIHQNLNIFPASGWMRVDTAQHTWNDAFLPFNLLPSPYCYYPYCYYPSIICTIVGGLMGIFCSKCQDHVIRFSRPIFDRKIDLKWFRDD